MRKGLKGENPDQEPQRRRWGGGERDADRRSHHVEIKARLNSGMQKLLHNDSVFWVVKPQVGREGISGLGTLLSGAYIELQPGTKGSVPAQYPLLDSPPLASPDAKGIRILLESSKAGQLSPGDPVLFRGYRVGSVETSTFDTQKRRITYQLFINAPNDRLVTPTFVSGRTAGSL